MLDDRHLDRLVGCGRRGVRLAEPRVIPAERLRLDPLRLALLARVFDDDAHAVSAVVIGEIAHDPDAGVIHFDDAPRCARPCRATAPARPLASARDCRRARRRGRRGRAARGCGSRVALAFEHMEQHALALLDADGLAVSQHPAVDAEQLVADFEALGLSPVLRRRPPAPSACSSLIGSPGRKSIAMSPPRLKVGANSFSTRNTSRS